MRHHTFRGSDRTAIASSPAHRRPRAARLLALLAVLAMVVGMAPTGASAQEGISPETVYVETTGHTVGGRFLAVWREHRGFLGDPVTEPVKRKMDIDGVETKTRTVQYFQNAALIQTLDDERGDDWDVQALPLGEAALDRDHDELKRAALKRTVSCGEASADECRVFDETDHTLRERFKSYWERNGGEQLIGAPITEEVKTAEGWHIQYFQRAVLKWTDARDVVPSAVGKRFLKAETIDPAKIKRPRGVPVYEESLFVEPIQEVAEVVEVEEAEEAAGGVSSGPGPQQGAYKEIVVSVAQQYLWAYEGNSVVVETFVSTGTAEVPETTTPQGFWSVNTKVDVQDMEGTISDEYYFVADVPYVMYFDGAGNAIHGAYWHSNFGTPMSHGCVNLPMDVAALLYGWADVGTAVTVI